MNSSPARTRRPSGGLPLTAAATSELCRHLTRVYRKLNIHSRARTRPALLPGTRVGDAWCGLVRPDAPRRSWAGLLPFCSPEFTWPQLGANV
jgi:hypothetical protein